MATSATNSVSQAQAGALGFQIQIAVQKRQLDAQKLAGSAAIELLQAAAELSKAAGKGAAFDAVA